jgi:hypothetical protein
MDRFNAINSAAPGLLSDPDLGKKDVTSRLWDVLGRLTKGDNMTAQHAVQFMQDFPSDPNRQAKAIQGVYAQTLDALQKGQAYIGQTQGIQTGGGTKFVRAPGFGGQPQDMGFVPNTLQPGTPAYRPGTNEQFYTGGTGNPGIMPPANGAPARPKVPSSTRVVGDDEGVRSGLYPSSGAPGTVLAAPAPGEAEAQKGSADAFVEARNAAGRYAQRVNPLRQAIPLIEKMKETEIGPTSERWNDIKSAAQTLGAGTLAGIDPEKIKNYNELKKYFNQYSAQAAATLGPRTNEGLATAVTSNPNVHMDKLSATDLSKVALGIERMQQAGVREFQEQVRAGKAKPGNFSDFLVDWATKQDPRAYVYDIMDKKSQDRIDTLKGTELKKFLDGIRLAKKWNLIGDVHGE